MPYSFVDIILLECSQYKVQTDVPPFTVPYYGDCENIFKSIATIFDSAASISKSAIVLLALP